MPYIKQEARIVLEDEARKASNAGELNYKITMLLRSYVAMKGEGYQTYNDIMGALEGAKLEIYRRRIARYEDDKITENGDVY